MKWINNPKFCMVCFEPPEPGFELIKHHIQYFPEVVCFVHYKCHEAIHAGKRPDLIQYNEGDSRRFYEESKGLKSST